MSKRLYVGSLAYSVTDAGLWTLFTRCGEVSFAKVMTDPISGQTRGFGFVEMFTAEGTEKAIAELHGSLHEGRKITVSVAHSNATMSGKVGRSLASRHGRTGTAQDARSRLSELGRAASQKGKSQ
ncbi:hypothetical protein OEIGOIKO_03377 [Streptomyces chrestomyceticus JCM 4735]|uniref:RRM domain-containing protein n=1 Tax=Streptomyces chrestomyceticus JCM 4735 TaxID=1306181 RepID=A0A7U9KX65_9ACTN|nr:RNA-binding protein [Streptomyces chrestomyceticus]GCD35631.1 hypothetical protein OEIGOIKO_03377 [Streptomyces chrestomyceticus JCM 4735]